MDMGSKINRIFLYLGVSTAVTLVAVASYNVYKRQNSIEHYKYETVGQVTNFRSNRSFSYYDYQYYYKGTAYSSYKDLDNFEGEGCIGRFYKVELSTENPQFSNILLDEEVIDTSTITSAGFEYPIVSPTEF